MKVKTGVKAGAGDKVQHENGLEIGPGSDARDNQVGGD